MALSFVYILKYAIAMKKNDNILADSFTNGISYLVLGLHIRLTHPCS